MGNLHKKRLISAANTMNISLNNLIILLLQRSRVLFGNQPELFRTVQYQRFIAEQPIIMHIEIPEVEYEYAVAMRYVFKMSVSFIVRLCIDRLLQPILSKYREEKAGKQADYVTTNFLKEKLLIRDYSITHTFSLGKEHWKLNWDRKNDPC